MSQHPDVQSLLEVDQRDQAIARLDDERAFLERSLGKERSRVEDFEAKVAAARGQLKEHQKHVDQIDLDMRANADKQQKLRIQQNQVKTNEEYSALGRQIEGLGKDSEQKEDAALQLYEKQEQVEAQIRELEEELKEAQADLAERQAEVNEEGKRIQGERDELVAARETAIEAVGKQTRSLYERVLEKVNGRALASLAGRKCRGCYVELPTNTVALVLGGKEIVRCPQCARFLYAEAGAEAASHSYLAGGDRSTPMPGD
jgi:predicted  nucleic acid-binding Zn-ribbon protein